MSSSRDSVFSEYCRSTFLCMLDLLFPVSEDLLDLKLLLLPYCQSRWHWHNSMLFSIIWLQQTDVEDVMHAHGS